ncbi:hypothetical protein [Singulisphaera sp. PoT]|uniref:hypothetical protein n=1 Tax=Singulisphaera sp. PoT TaxID=3411797 RepID=UPI003BF5E678
MYPAHLFNLFPPFPREDKVFVAMCFHPRFDARWKHVIEPAIREIGLEPYRVDKGKVNDSILTDITKSISSHRLIFADISAMGSLDTGGKNSYVVRNGNVMYEVGVAQAVRLPEEVVLFRSDDEELPFDVVNIRVNSYDPDNKVDEAKASVSEALRNAMHSIEQSRSLSVESVMSRLDDKTLSMLYEMSAAKGPFRLSKEQLLESKSNISYQTMSRLLDLGLIQSSPIILTEEMIHGKFVDELSSGSLTYKLTSFGWCVRNTIYKRTYSVLHDNDKHLITEIEGEREILKVVSIMDLPRIMKQRREKNAGLDAGQ